MEIPIIDMGATGKKIRRLRTERGISVREVQETMGFAYPQSVYNWENGHSLPMIDNLVILAWAFGVKMDDIIEVL